MTEKGYSKKRNGQARYTSKKARPILSQLPETVTVTVDNVNVNVALTKPQSKLWVFATVADMKALRRLYRNQEESGDDGLAGDGKADDNPRESGDVGLDQDLPDAHDDGIAEADRALGGG